MTNEVNKQNPDELRGLLARWATPSASFKLDARILSSYRQMLAEKSLFIESPQDQAAPGKLEFVARQLNQEENPMKTHAPAAYTRPEYHLTVLEDASLTRRLAREFSALKAQSALTWPEFKRSPATFARRAFAVLAALLVNFFRSPYALTATVSAVLLVMSAVLAAIFADSLRPRATPEQLEISEIINLNDTPKEEPPPEKSGPAGTNKGAGGGSKTLPEKPHGGGGGGDVNETRDTSRGEIPPLSRAPQIVVPKPLNAPERPPLLPVMPTLKGDEALSRAPRSLDFGDPDSKSNDPSRGQGEGEGMGGGKGTGAGRGDGAGLGNGRGENTGGGDGKYGGDGIGGGSDGGPLPKPKVDYNRPYSIKEVDRKAQILAKPEPHYTDEARRENITGVVSLRVLLNANGTVSNIAPISRLPNGLTDKAIEAARKIRFTPAQKDGRNVSQWIVLQYEFNLY